MPLGFGSLSEAPLSSQTATGANPNVGVTLTGNHATAKAGAVGAPPSNVPPALDATATYSGSGVSSTAVTLTTGAVNAIVVLNCFYGAKSSGTPPTVSSITDTAGLTWHKRGAGTTGLINMEVWWALAPAKLTSDVITVAWSATGDDVNLIACSFKGCNTAAPWDSNSALPAFTYQASGSTPVSTYTTTQSADLLLTAVGTNSSATINSPPSGFTLLANQNNGSGQYWAETGIAGLGVTAAQSAVAKTWTASYNAQSSFIVYTDALTSQSAGTTLALTGNHATAKAGTVTARSSNVTVALTGQHASAKKGALTPTFPKTLTGRHATAKAGAFTPTFPKTLTGQHASAKTGTLTASQAVTIALTGRHATAKVGEPTSSQAVSIALGGHHATGKIGTITVLSGLILALTGNKASGKHGTPTTSQALSRTLTGAHAAAKAGVLKTAQALSRALGGEHASAKAGGITAAQILQRALSGQHAAGKVGKPGVVHARALTGRHANAYTGMVETNANVEARLQGKSAEAKAGSVTPAHVIALKGNHATGHARSPSYATHRALTGYHAVGHAGLLTTGQAITHALRGAHAAARAGHLVPANAPALHGQHALAHAGALKSVTLLAGQRAIARQHAPTPNLILALTGHRAIARSGIFALGNVFSISTALVRTAPAEVDVREPQTVAMMRTASTDKLVVQQAQQNAQPITANATMLAILAPNNIFTQTD